MIILRAIKVFTSCTSVEQKFVQANCDRRHSFALVHRSCEEVAVFVHYRVFAQLVSHILRAVHQKEKLSLENKSNWVLG